MEAGIVILALGLNRVNSRDTFAFIVHIKARVGIAIAVDKKLSVDGHNIASRLFMAAIVIATAAASLVLVTTVVLLLLVLYV